MDIAIPAVLKSISSAGSAAKEITAWWRKAKGDSRSLIGEIKENLIYLDMVAEDGVQLGDVIEKIGTAEYKRLAKAGFNFNTLRKSRIAKYPSLDGTDLASWNGKETEALVESIYDKVNDLKIRYPHVKQNANYRWNVRVHNIRKRIWLLLMHVRS
jgi:hypothetical protein